MQKDYKENGSVIWLTGLPGSGKTTIAKRMEKYFLKKKMPVQILDGDSVRKNISKGLGFSKRDREENAKRVINLASKLAKKGTNVIVALVSPYRKIRMSARRKFPNFLKIYVKCGVEECARRKNKRELYKRAIRGELKNFTGISDPYEKPQKPDVVLDTEKKSLKQNEKIIIDYLEKWKPLFLFAINLEVMETIFF